MPRPYVQAERRLIAEWAMDRYPGDDVVRAFNVRVGAGPPMLGEVDLTAAEWRATVGQMRRYVDCVVVLPDRVVLAEAKIVAKPDALGQLLMYRELAPHSPELFGYRELPLDMVLVVAVEDSALTAYAARHGVRTDVFRPEWVTGYLAERPHRQRTPAEVDASVVSTGAGSE